MVISSGQTPIRAPWDGVPHFFKYYSPYNTPAFPVYVFYLFLCLFPCFPIFTPPPLFILSEATFIFLHEFFVEQGNDTCLTYVTAEPTCKDLQQIFQTLLVICRHLGVYGCSATKNVWGIFFTHHPDVIVGKLYMLEISTVDCFVIKDLCDVECMFFSIRNAFLFYPLCFLILFPVICKVST